MLAVVFKMGDHIFAGPTQILSDTTSSSPADVLQCLESLEKALGGKLPAKGEQIQVNKNTFSFKEYRKSAKGLICGLVNSVSHILPRFTLAQSVPVHPLRPAGIGWDRVECLPAELEVWGQEFGKAFFRHCPETGESSCDFYCHSDPLVRLCFSADEGTEATILKKEGLGMFELMFVHVFPKSFKSTQSMHVFAWVTKPCAGMAGMAVWFIKGLLVDVLA